MALLVALISITAQLPFTSAAARTGEASRVEITSDFEPLPNFDIRWAARPRAGAVDVEQKKRTLSASARPDSVVLRWDDRMDLPHHLLALDAPLTGESDDDRVAIAKRFALDNNALFRLSQRELDLARVSALATDDEAGLVRLALEQRVKGVRVFGADMIFNLDRRGRILSESGSFIPGLELRAPDPAPLLTAEEALSRSASLCGVGLTSEITATADQTPARERVLFSSEQVDGRSEASLVYYAITPDDVRLAYQVLLYGVPTALDSYLILVDAQTGQALRRDSLTYSMDAPVGRVFTKENPIVSGQRELVSFKGDATASPSTWVAGGETAGNNARVFFNPELTGGSMVKANSDGNFDFPIDLAAGRSPLDSSSASAANLFYWVNVAHDKFYDLGFDEAARNFQVDNFNRGGRGGDPVRADTLRGAKLTTPQMGAPVRNNAYFQVTVEGSQPLLAMLAWDGASNGQAVLLDSSYDAGVIIHEYTHGVSTRLTGTDNSVGLGSIQGGGMGEGWSDFFAMSFLNTSDLPLDTPYATGSYVTGRARGVRAYPYSTSFEANTLTFGDIRFNSEVHAQGTVWCTALWGMRQALIARYGLDEGRRTAERLVVAGLKLTPQAPTFIDARDAILLADRTTNNGANQDLIWGAFARRGLGKSATVSNVSSPVGFRISATEAYDVPVEFSAGALVINDKPPAPAVIGEPLTLVVVDRDLAASTSVDVRAVNERTGAGVTLTLTQSGGAGRFAGSLSLNFPAQDGGPRLALAANPGDVISITYSNARNSSGAAETVEARTLAGRRTTVYSLDFEQGAVGWTLQGDWHITERRSVSPARSLYFAARKGENDSKSYTKKGRSGQAFSPQVDLGGLIRPRLEFDYFFSGATGGDAARPTGDVLNLVASNYPFVGSTAQFASEARLLVNYDLRPLTEAAFHTTSVDLTFIETRRAYLSFNFSPSAADLKRKKLEGFYVDNVRITAVSTR
jgi:hypothetical protein